MARDRRARRATRQTNGASRGSRPTTLAFLQYTSGSTASPKGVMVSHANLLHNLAYAQSRRGERRGDACRSRGCRSFTTWVSSKACSSRCSPAIRRISWRPASFLQRPIRWLRAITRYRATNSGGPNFAYDLCVRKITDAQRDELDLVVVARRVQRRRADPRATRSSRSTSDSETSAFAGARSIRSTGWPKRRCSSRAGGRDYEAVIHDADAGASGARRVSRRDERRRRSRVRPWSCGTARIRHARRRSSIPRHAQSCADGEIGEIWVASPSVARGYWRREQLTRRDVRRRARERRRAVSANRRPRRAARRRAVRHRAPQGSADRSRPQTLSAGHRAHGRATACGASRRAAPRRSRSTRRGRDESRSRSRWIRARCSDDRDERERAIATTSSRPSVARSRRSMASCSSASRCCRSERSQRRRAESCVVTPAVRRFIEQIAGRDDAVDAAARAAEPQSTTQ